MQAQPFNPVIAARQEAGSGGYPSRPGIHAPVRLGYCAATAGLGAELFGFLMYFSRMMVISLGVTGP